MTGLLRASSGKTDYFDRKRKFSRHNFPVANFCLKFADENPSLTERRTKTHWITNIYFTFIKEGNQSLTVNFLKLDAEFTPGLKDFRTPETNVK